jgi:hypothetical protein
VNDGRVIPPGLDLLVVPVAKAVIGAVAGQATKAALPEDQLRRFLGRDPQRFGLARCRYHGQAGMERWVGLGLLAHNLRQISRSVAARSVA